jgi:pimeloyl-ACP methyl ester carboxylesterase
MINDQTGMRQLTTLDGDGLLLHGTYHKPRSAAADGAPVSTKTLGVMFMNALSSPRSLVGDSGGYWAQCFADCGYPSFRFDLPGLGDSYGEIPNDLLRFTNEGGYASVASSKARELVERHRLSGVVMFGHCAGATTAIYAASNCTDCKGLVLMDPYFNLPKALTATLRPGLVLWARRSKVGAMVRTTYDRVREFPGVLRKGALPANANFSLISRFKQVVSRGVPLLIFKAYQPAVGSGTVTAGFDYLSYISSCAVRTNQFSIRTIEETDHSFANRAGRLAVRQHTETWLSEYFPEGAATTPLLQRQDSQIQAPLTLGNPFITRVSPGD